MDCTQLHTRTGSAPTMSGRIGLLGCMLGLALTMPAAAQTAAWTVQILRPPGMPESAGTPVAPAAPGQGTPQQAQLGAAVKFVDGRLWIGSPGHQQNGLRGGAVWIRALPGTGATSPAEPLLPSEPVDGLRYGAAIATDDYSDYAAVLARPASAQTSPDRVWVHSTQTPYTGARWMSLPPIDVTYGGGLSIFRTAVFVSRRSLVDGELHAQVLIYHPWQDAQYRWVETIELPTQGLPTDAYTGMGVEVAEEATTLSTWLVSGARVYEGLSTAAQFGYSHPLPLPMTPEGYGPHLLAQHRGLLLLNGHQAQAYLGRFFPLVDGTGWSTLYGGAEPEGFTIEGACKAVAFDDGHLACLRTDANGAYLLIAEKGGAAAPELWGRIVGSARVPVPASAFDPPVSLAISGPHVAIGWPRSGDEGGIVDAGMVVIMTLEGGLFSSGFE
jgi:hypothetical protein